jgi:hypothetical protein
VKPFDHRALDEVIHGRVPHSEPHRRRTIDLGGKQQPDWVDLGS